jgi:hypothetical protein
MINPDVIDVLLSQHVEIHRLCAKVQEAGGAERQQLFDALARLVHLHEVGERSVAHRAVRSSNKLGDEVGRACMLEERTIDLAIDELQGLGVEHADFDAGFASLRQAIADHAAREERDEFPLLRRYVPVDRLHMMAGELHDIQLMAAR